VEGSGQLCHRRAGEFLRLDQQRLDKYHLLERDGAPRYGTVMLFGMQVQGRWWPISPVFNV